jgi:hypothetical protein
MSTTAPHNSPVDCDPPPPPKRQRINEPPSIEILESELGRSFVFETYDLQNFSTSEDIEHSIFEITPSTDINQSEATSEGWRKYFESYVDPWIPTVPWDDTIAGLPKSTPNHPAIGTRETLNPGIVSS